MTEDDECVNRSPISPAAVYVHVFRTSKNGNNCINFEDERQLGSAHVQLFVCSIDRYTWNQSVLSFVPWLL